MYILGCFKDRVKAMAYIDRVRLVLVFRYGCEAGKHADHFKPLRGWFVLLLLGTVQYETNIDVWAGQCTLDFPQNLIQRPQNFG